MKKTIIRITAITLYFSSHLAMASAKSDMAQFSNIVKAGVFACEEQFTVLFGNGITNTEKDARNSKLKLQKQVDAKLIPDLKEKTVYNNVYNPTEGYLRDIGEATSQKINADRKQFIEWLADSALAPTWFQNYVKDLIEKHNKERILASDVTQSHVAIYNSLLGKGRQIAPVMHSQGNLFINEAYSGIKEPLKQGMGIVSVANPDDVVADMDQRHAYENTNAFSIPGDIFYLNAEEDHLMGLIGTGDRNFDNYIDDFFAPDGILGHSFINVYMDTSTANRPNPTSAQVIVDETLARHDKTTLAKCRTASSLQRKPICQ